jgi:hypothetical protein
MRAAFAALYPGHTQLLEACVPAIDQRANSVVWVVRGSNAREPWNPPASHRQKPTDSAPFGDR